MNEKLLTKEQCEQVTVDIVSSFENELSRIQNKTSIDKIIVFIYGLHYDQQLYSFFTPISVKTLTEDVFTDTVIRSFILNLTERLSLLWSNSELEYSDKFLDTFVSAICTNKQPYGEKTNSLINREVLESIEMVPDVFKALLKDNMWLLIIYLLTINLHRSNILQALKEATNAT